MPRPDRLSYYSTNNFYAFNNLLWRRERNKRNKKNKRNPVSIPLEKHMIVNSDVYTFKITHMTANTIISCSVNIEVVSDKHLQFTSPTIRILSAFLSYPYNITWDDNLHEYYGYFY